MIERYYIDIDIDPISRVEWDHGKPIDEIMTAYLSPRELDLACAHFVHLLVIL